VEDDKTGNQELLVARDNKRCGEICREMQYVLEDEE